MEKKITKKKKPLVRVIHYRGKEFNLPKDWKVFRIDESTGIVTEHTLKQSPVEFIENLVIRDNTKHYTLEEVPGVDYVPALTINKARIKFKFAYRKTHLKVVEGD